MRDKLYEIIEGDELFHIPEDNDKYLIEGFLREGDYISIVASPKMGKTILAQQMACSLSSGKDFLGKFKTPKAIPVWYFATEGRANDLKDRFIRMNKMVTINKNNLKLIPCNFRFNTNEGVQSLSEIEAVLKDSPPGAIVVDALYRGVKGSLKDDAIVNDFHHRMGLLQKKYGCAIITIHHARKPVKNESGKYEEMSDIDIYGSTFLFGGVDHIIWLEKFNKTPNSLDRTIKCTGQRSGEVIDNLRVRLIQPEPLGFEIVSIHEEDKLKVIDSLRINPKGLTIQDIEFKTNVCRTTLYVIKPELVEEYGIHFKTKEGTRQVLWIL